MAGRRSSSSSSSSNKRRTSSGGSASSIVKQLEMLRNFCPDFSEGDLSSCLSQAGYNVELAAERLMTGQYQPKTPTPARQQHRAPSHPTTNNNDNDMPSAVKAAPPSHHSTPASSSSAASTSKKRHSSNDSYTKNSRPSKKQSPHLIPATPRYTSTNVPSSSTVQTPQINDTPKATTLASSSGLLLCERWVVGHCTQRSSRVAYQQGLDLQHYHTGQNTSVRFRSHGDGRVQGNLEKPLSAMLTPLLRRNLIELRASALMEDTDIPIGGDVAMNLRVSIQHPREFFALFENIKKDDGSTKSSLFFRNQNNNQRTLISSKMTVSEAAFAFLQWAHYGDAPDFAPSVATENSAAADNEESDSNCDDDDDDDESNNVVLQEDDFEGEVGSEESPAWAKDINNQSSDSEEANSKQRLPELDDPLGFDESVVLRPYQRQALYWMMKREEEGESREELEKELALLSELAAHSSTSSHKSVGGGTTQQPPIFCECGPVLVSDAGRKAAKTVDGQANPVNHPLWKPRYLADSSMENAVLFYVNELLGIATCHPPAPPKQCSGGILADDMGLGKTVMLLALILKHKEKQQAEGNTSKRLPTLVVAPLSLITQWEEEIKTKTSLSCRVCYGDQAKGKSSLDDFDVDVVVTTYGKMQGEIQRRKKDPNCTSDKGYGLLQREWLRVILDEAHCIKNQATLASKACCALKAQYRWVVTGTVIHNSLDDVFGLLKFLRHQPWCDATFWKTAITSEMNRTSKLDDSESGESEEPSGTTVALGRVRRLLGPLMLRRTKNSLSADGKPILTLPPVETAVIDVTLSEAEREFYNALLMKSQDIFDGFIKQGTASKSWFAIFSLLHRLRMSCDHIALTVKSKVDEDEWNTADEKEDKCAEASQSASNDSVDDAFINELLLKFRKTANAIKVSDASNTNDGSYSVKVAHALNNAIQGNATHIAEECPICLDTPLIHEACMTGCAHTFCRECLLDYLKERSPKKTGNSLTQSKFPDGDCPVCQSKVESASVILLSKDLEGQFQSSFLSEKKLSPASNRIKVETEGTANDGRNDAARQILEESMNEGTESSKQARIISELHEVWKADPGSNVVIFSQFLGFLSILETSFRAIGIPFGRLDGKMSLKQRVAALEAFKARGRPPESVSSSGSLSAEERIGSVMLVSMKAGGCGLNLVSASTVFLCDPWWSNALEEQCINRVHRIGQTASVVRVRKFVVADSVEERIVKLQEKKKDMASHVYSDANAGTMSSSKPTLEDFQLIFKNM